MLVGLFFYGALCYTHATQSPPFYMLFGFMAGLVVALISICFHAIRLNAGYSCFNSDGFWIECNVLRNLAAADSMTAFFDLMLQNITLLPQLAMNPYTLVPAFMPGGALMYAGLGFGTFAAGALAAALVLAGGSIVFLGRLWQ